MTEQNAQPFEISKHIQDLLRDHLLFLYGQERCGTAYQYLSSILERYAQYHHSASTAQRPNLTEQFTQADAILITYGDQVSEPGVASLRTLAFVLEHHFTALVSGIHLLPFYPYTSDDGFSVVDYTQVNPQLGDWDDVALVGRHFRLMFDLVINHISASSAWFQAFLRDEDPYTGYFINVDPSIDLSGVTRPRALPLLTPFETPSGTKHVWTTFSADQIDLNFANPEVLLAMIEVLLYYIARGAEIIRLDAIGYLWKEIGTNCIHLPQTHRAVQLFRTVLDAVAPHVTLITETNVPHQDNISYFGDGTNEAQLVYQFPLAPLVLNAFVSESAQHLTHWAANLESAGEHVTFFNFLASHDGIGVTPVLGILDWAAIDQLVERTRAHGGHVSFKNNPDGTQSPYELNITFFDALSDPHANEAPAIQRDRFIVSQAIMLALAGLPGIYINSLLGSHNDHAGVAATGRYRSINRQKWQRADLDRQLADQQSHAAQILARYATLLRARAADPAFKPSAPQFVIAAHPTLFVLLRGEPGAQVLCIHNVSSHPQRLDLTQTGWDASSAPFHDLISDAQVMTSGSVAESPELDIAPYQALWLRPA
ncbi:MAG: sugar phosphorylase [Chloroflexales bacterium]|nr:sugar phosphorylase [Chloroflexales bacterium]